MFLGCESNILYVATMNNFTIKIQKLKTQPTFVNKLDFESSQTYIDCVALAHAEYLKSRHFLIQYKILVLLTTILFNSENEPSQF